MYEVLAPLMNTETLVMFKATAMFPALVLIVTIFTFAVRKEA